MSYKMVLAYAKLNTISFGTNLPKCYRCQVFVYRYVYVKKYIQYIHTCELDGSLSSIDIHPKKLQCCKDKIWEWREMSDLLILFSSVFSQFLVVVCFNFCYQNKRKTF